MEMVILATLLGLNMVCTVACLVILLLMFGAKERDGHSTPVFTQKHSTAEEDDVEKRRRAAVEARQNQNFMDYDGTVQNPIDPNLILADGG